MLEPKNRLISDINLLLNSVRSYKLLFPIGCKFLEEYADREFFDVAIDLFSGYGFDKEHPLDVSNLKLFHLLKCLERNISTLRANQNGLLLKQFKISIPPYRNDIFKKNHQLISIYNKNDEYDTASYFFRCK